MNHKTQNRLSDQCQLHFKQWSNKGYAAFCSMGKVVSIGSLTISLAQWMGGVIDHVEELISVRVEQDEDEVAEELLEQVLLQAVPVVIIPCEREKSIYFRFKNINYR